MRCTILVSLGGKVTETVPIECEVSIASWRQFFAVATSFPRKELVRACARARSREPGRKPVELQEGS